MKKLLLSAILYLSLNADTNIDNAVSNIIGVDDFNTHRNLINRIFQDSTSFYNKGSLDYIEISQALQNNNLLKLSLGYIQNIDMDFIFSHDPKKSFKNINDILRVLGQRNYITTSQVVVDNQLKWSIKVQTATAISPLRLSQELQSINCRIVDIKKEGNNKWSYYIDSRKASVYKAEDLVTKDSVSFRKPTKPYMVEIADTNLVQIESKSGNKWYPSIVFYDTNFNVIKIFESEELHKNLQIDVPTNCRFIKIDDFYALTNIKNGLTITKE